MGDKARTTETLRQTLFDAIDRVVDGSLGPSEASQIAKLADQIVKTADLEMRYTEHVGKMDERELAPGPMLLGHDKEES